MWQTPKTNWAPPDPVGPSDFNRIEGNTAHLYTEISTMYPRIIKAGTRNPGVVGQQAIIPSAFTVPAGKLWMMFIQPIGSYLESTGQVFGEVEQREKRYSYQIALQLDSGKILQVTHNLGTTDIDVSFAPTGNVPTWTAVGENAISFWAQAGSYQGEATIYGRYMRTLLQDDRALIVGHAGGTVEQRSLLLQPGGYTSLDARCNVVLVSGTYVQPFMYLLVEIDQSVA